MSASSPQSSPRPRFTEREGRLLLASVYAKKEAEPEDRDWKRLFERLQRLWGDDGA